MSKLLKFMTDRLPVVSKYVAVEAAGDSDRLQFLVKSVLVNKELFTKEANIGNEEAAVYFFSRACVNVGEFHERHAVEKAEEATKNE